MIQALKLWKKNLPTDNQANCKYFAAQELHCLSAKAHWHGLLQLDRPVILEFSSSSEEKRYALLVGVSKGQPLIRFNGDLSFPLDEVLNLWTGNYILPWQSPRPGMMEIAPKQKSTNVLWLRRQLSAATGQTTASDEPLIFDASLKSQVINFQRKYHLLADGLVGARTLILLDNTTGAVNSQHLKISD